jgi:uncharacterized membrane protein YedE/YeeE
MTLIEFISQPWHWSVSGVGIVLVMFLLVYFGKEFGVSATLRTMCAISGAGKKYAFFDFDWKSQVWNIVFILGAVIGGFIASTVLASPEPLVIGERTVEHLNQLGISTPEQNPSVGGFLPLDIFNFENLLSPLGFVVLVIGGFMIGFGSRWAGGCTSGHAISGLSNLQLPSLIAVIGFFIGGLLMTHLILPFLFSL